MEEELETEVVKSNGEPRKVAFELNVLREISPVAGSVDDMDKGGGGKAVDGVNGAGYQEEREVVEEEADEREDEQLLKEEDKDENEDEEKEKALLTELNRPAKEFVRIIMENEASHERCRNGQAVSVGPEKDEFRKYKVLEKPWKRFKVNLGRNPYFYKMWTYMGLLTGFPFNLVVKQYSSLWLFVWCAIAFVVPPVCFGAQFVYTLVLYENQDLQVKRMIEREAYLVLAYCVLQVFSTTSLLILYYEQVFHKELKNMVKDLFADLDTGPYSGHSYLNIIYRLSFCRLCEEMKPRIYKKLGLQRVLILIGTFMFFISLFHLSTNGFISFESHPTLMLLSCVPPFSGIALANSFITINVFGIFWSYKFKHLKTFIDLLEKDPETVAREFNERPALGCFSSRRWFKRKITIYGNESEDEMKDKKKDECYQKAIVEYNERGLESRVKINNDLLLFIKQWYGEHYERSKKVSQLFGISFTVVFISILFSMLVFNITALNTVQELLGKKKSSVNDISVSWTIFMGISVLTMMGILIAIAFDAANVSEEAEQCSTSLSEAGERMTTDENDPDHDQIKMFQLETIAGITAGTMSRKPTVHFLGVFPITKKLVVTMLGLVFSIPFAINRVMNF